MLRHTRRCERGGLSVVRMIATIVLASCVGAGALEAQGPGDRTAQSYDLRTDSHIGAGYVGNLPNVTTGAFFFHLLGNRWGYFLDGKHTFGTQEDTEFFEEGLTSADAEGFGHVVFDEEKEYTSFGAGAMYAFHSEMAVYVGLGYSERRAFTGFRDTRDPPEFGDAGGNYWVHDEAESDTGLNPIGGVVIQAGSHFFLRVGGELFPAGANVGLALTLPR